LPNTRIGDVLGMSLICHRFDKRPSHGLRRAFAMKSKMEMADEALKTGVSRTARYAELPAARTRSRREIEACAPCSQ